VTNPPSWNLSGNKKNLWKACFALSGSTGECESQDRFLSQIY